MAIGDREPMTMPVVRYRAAAAVVVCLVLLLNASPSSAAVGERLDFPLRGQHLTLTVYVPPGGSEQDQPAKVKGTIIMASGDVGWVGLAVTLSEFLCDRGYIV